MHQSDADQNRVWTAGIVMALVTIMKKTGIQSGFGINAFNVMFTYLCLKKSQREFIVGLMEPSLKSVMFYIVNKCLIHVIFIL